MPMTRSEAKKLGLSKYDTGQPCKNGHHAFRYVQSGTCSDCIRAGRPIIDPALKTDLVQLRVRIFSSDRDDFALSVWAVVVMRYPHVTLGDVDRRLLPTLPDEHSGLYAFNCHIDDIPTIRDMANLNLKSRPFNVAEHLVRIHGSIIAKYVK